MTTTGTPHTPAHHPEPAGTGLAADGPPSSNDLLEEFSTTGGTVELFPVNFTAYRHNPDLETDEHVRKIAHLLAPYGLHVNRWTTPGDQRDRQAVEERLGTWKRPDGEYGNTVLYWVGHGSAENLAHHRTPAPIDDGITPYEVARAIASRQLHPDAEDSWAIVVLDACFSHRFAQKVQRELLDEYGDAKRYLLLSTAARGHAELGTFAQALDRVLNITFRGRSTIHLAELGFELGEDLGGFRNDTAERRNQLTRTLPDVASAVSAPLDQLAEIQSVIDQLSVDERRHFVPKASGAEFGELAWYFHGRTAQRDRILNWLTTTTQGALVVTGPAGAGKSALLGHILLHTRTELRDILVRYGHLSPLPPSTPRPDNPFDLVAHLSGVTLNRSLQLVAEAADLSDLAHEATQGRPSSGLADRLITELRTRQTRLTLLFDALDEAEQPLVIADTLLRPLASLPTVRLVIGTRRSTRERPDQPALAHTDLLDTLQPRRQPTGGKPTFRLELVEVDHDQEALAGYLQAKLTSAKDRGALNADDTDITALIRRLVTDYPQSGVAPQQFLYARLAAHELLNDPHLVTDPSPLIGRTHRQLFTRALERLHRTNPHYTPLLQALGLAQGRGLPDQGGIWATVADALESAHTGTRDSIPNLLHDAAPYLALDQEHGQSVYRLAHRTFTEHFISASDTIPAHAAITTALIHRATLVLEPPNTHDSSTTRGAPPTVNPYIRHHLAAHARLGHSAGAFDVLGENPSVLDALDLGSITTAVLGYGLPSDLPAAIAGVVLLQHHARDTTLDQQDDAAVTAWRRWFRRLGTTYVQGTPPPTEPQPHGPGTAPPDLIAGFVRRHPLHLQLAGHTGRVRAVAAFTTPDEILCLATAGDDGTVRIWNPITGSQLGEPLTGHTGRVRAVAAFTTPDGTPHLATAGDDGTVRIWNPITGSQLGEPLTGHTGRVRAVAAFTTPDEILCLATAGDDGTVRIWNPITGSQLGEPLTGHTGRVRAVAAFTTPDGTPHLATAGDDGRTRIWNPITRSQTAQLIGHTGRVNAVAAFTAPDGSPRLATASNDRTIRIWNPIAGTRLGEPLTGHTGRVSAMTIFTAPDETPRLITASHNGEVRLWRPAAGSRRGEPLTSHPGRVNAVAVFTAPDGTPRLATAGDNGTVRIWDPAAGSQLGEPLTGHLGWVDEVVVFAAPDGTPRVATTDRNGEVWIWDPAAGSQLGEPLTGHPGRVDKVVGFTAPDGTHRLVTTDRNGGVWIRDPAAGGQPTQLIGHTGWVEEVVVFAASDGTPRLVTADWYGSIRIWDPATGGQTAQLTGHTGRVSVMAVFAAPDGTPRLVTASGNGEVWIWDPATGGQTAQLTGHTGRVRAMAVFAAPDGTHRLAIASDDGTVRIWNPANGAETVLPLAAPAHSLAGGYGLFVAGTAGGFLCFDLSTVCSRPTDIGSPGTSMVSPSSGTPAR